MQPQNILFEFTKTVSELNFDVMNKKYLYQYPQSKQLFIFKRKLNTGFIRECPTHSIRHYYTLRFVLALFFLNYKIKTKTPIVYGSVFNVRALKEAH